MSSKLRVLVAVPNTGSIGRFVVCMLDRMKADDRFDCLFSYPSASPSENTRAHIMREVLDREFDFLVSIDSDNPPLVNPLDLIDHDKDIIGLPTRVWQHGGLSTSHHWNVYDDLGDEGFRPRPQSEGLEKVDAIGTGCYVAARRVFEALSLSRPYVRETFADGIVKVGSDLSFCRKARAAGFEIWVDWGYLCEHESHVFLLEVMRLNESVRAQAIAEVEERGPIERKDGMGRLRTAAVYDERKFTPDARPGYRAFDEMAVELETCEILYSMIRTYKPTTVVESGTGCGYATLAIAQALEDNGHGTLFTFERKGGYQIIAMSRLEGYGRVNWRGEGIRGDWEPEQMACNPEFVFLDSGPEDRPRELQFWMRERGVVLAVHDAARYPSSFVREQGTWFPVPRGLWVGDLRKE